MLLKNTKWIKRVCVIDSSYSLLIYFLISTQEDINATFFFWSKGIPDAVKSKFIGHNHSFISRERPKKWNLFENIKLHLRQLYEYYIESYLKFPFLLRRNITYWGHDHLDYSPMIVHSNKINVIEDGMMNYHSMKCTPHKKKWMGYIFGGPLNIRENYRFQQKTVSKEYLTGLIPNSPSMSSPKLVIVSLHQLWQNADEQKKSNILSYYNLTLDDIEELNSCDKVILTQPFSEDGYITESEKTKMYRDILSKVNTQNIIIKPHPRETTDYKVIFPDNYVFTKKIPMELIRLNGVSFKTVYTISSTAAYDFKDAEVVFCNKWPEINPKLARN